MNFKQAVAETPTIAQHYQPGIQALIPADKKRLVNAQRATGSVALDEALKSRFPNAHRWDYGIGLQNGAAEVLWLEVHHAASGETDRVIRKLQALKHWLQTEAPALNQMKPKSKFIWLLSNTETNPNDRTKRHQLAEKHGLRRHQGPLDLATL